MMVCSSLLTQFLQL
jgi:hypothetical protein